MIYIIPIYEVLHHVCEIGALSCIQGGGRSRQHHRRRSGPVYLPVRRQPVHQAAGGRAADPSVCPQLPWRGPDAGRPDAVRVRPQRHRPAGDRRGEAVPEPDSCVAHGYRIESRDQKVHSHDFVQ